MYAVLFSLFIALSWSFLFEIPRSAGVIPDSVQLLPRGVGLVGSFGGYPVGTIRQFVIPTVDGASADVTDFITNSTPGNLMFPFVTGFQVETEREVMCVISNSDFNVSLPGPSATNDAKITVWDIAPAVPVVIFESTLPATQTGPNSFLKDCQILPGVSKTNIIVYATESSYGIVYRVVFDQVVTGNLPVATVFAKSNSFAGIGSTSGFQYTGLSGISYFTRNTVEPFLLVCYSDIPSLSSLFTVDLTTGVVAEVFGARGPMCMCDDVRIYDTDSSVAVSACLGNSTYTDANFPARGQVWLTHDDWRSTVFQNEFQVSNPTSQLLGTSVTQFQNHVFLLTNDAFLGSDTFLEVVYTPFVSGSEKLLSSFVSLATLLLFVLAYLF